MDFTPEELTKMYRLMLTIRLFEERVKELYARALVVGLVHLYIGEEAVAVGACTALRREDYITSTHRGHGHCIAKGGRLDKMMAELFGKRTGYCKGKGGSMHIADLDIGILGAMGIVGSGVPIAVGAALSAQMRGTGQVALSFFGDGATNQGAFHEAANLAAAWKLPVVLVCENNLYAISLSQRNHQAITDIADRAVAYGMPAKVVDGNDVLAVREVVEEAVKRARAGEGPTLIECKTYRWRGHHEGDSRRGLAYRSEEQLQEWMEKDPTKRFESHLKAESILTYQELDRIKQQIEEEIEQAVEYAKDSPFPAPEEALEGVYGGSVLAEAGNPGVYVHS